MVTRRVHLTILMVTILVAAGTGAQGITFASTSESDVTISNLSLLSPFGEDLPGVMPGQQAILNFLLDGNEGTKYTAILELRDKNGLTIELFVRDGSIEETPEDVRIAWTASEPGIFEAHILVISSFESPKLLSGVFSTEVLVARSQSELEALLPKISEEGSQPANEVEEVLESGPKPYTFMVYMVASDLESTGYYATLDILEMMSVGSSENVNVVIQTGGSANSTVDDFRFIDFTKVQRHLVVKDDVKLVQDLGVKSMSSSSTLRDFVSWGVKDYPADKYAIILWDHGAGMVGFGYDDIHDDIFDLAELREGLYPIVQHGKQFELIGFDACLMASIEVANALSDRGKYLVASEELEPAWGMDFEAILNSINENPQQDGLDLGKTVSDSYMAHSREFSESFEDYSVDRALTMSVIDLEKIPTLVEAVDSVGGHIDKLGGDLEIAHTLTKTIRETERYGETGRLSTGHLDLYHMAENLDKEFPQLYGIGSKIRDRVEDAVVYKVGGNARTNSHGISMFMQVQEYEANAPHLRYIVGKWISVMTSARLSLDRDSSPPDIGLSMRNDKTLFGKIEGIDLDYVSTFVTQEVEENAYRIKLLSVVTEDASDFIKPDSLGFMSYNWSGAIMSLCNIDEKNCKPASVNFEKNGVTKYAYSQVRLESDRYNGTLWLIYIVNNEGSFEFVGGWPGVDENGNAIREMVPLVDGDRVYPSTYILRYDRYEDEWRIEDAEDPEAVIVSEGFGPVRHKFPGQYDLIISACDFSGNCGYSNNFEYDVS